jgi:hypothetical protein
MVGMETNAPELLQPLVNGWLGKLDIAAKHKRARFQDVADQCMMFYTNAAGMYEQSYQKKYVGGNFSPKFKIALNKAFEMVALFGPLINNRNPHREVNAIKGVDFGPEVFGDPNDPNVQTMFQQALAAEEQRYSVLKSGCQALERYLNYTPTEQPNGGLKQASEDACTEALVKGRGVCWTDAYTMPNSNRVMTGSFYDTVDRLLIDPDSESSNFGEAYWVAKLCIEPHWKAERDRGLPFGCLRNKNGIESLESRGAQQGNSKGKREHELGNSFDLIRYWKIWSIGGVGTRLTGTSKVMQTAFDDVVGDYAYLEVARGVPFLLNLPKEKFLQATDDDVRAAFAWPVPYWKDQRWPCVWLDFYRQPNNAWPIAPMAPGLGELIALNIIMSRLTFNIYQTTRSLVAVLKSAQRDVEAALKSNEDEVVFGIPEILKDIDSVIKFIQGPSVHMDAFSIVERLFSIFDARVGLTPLMYGLNPGAASRTSDDAGTKQQMLSIRPDYMASKVEAFHVELARNEKVCAYYSGVNGETVKPMTGEVGAYLFDQTFANAGEETVLREMTCSIAIGSARKPNRQQDAANLKEIYQPISIQLGQVAAQTGDYTKLDTLNNKLGESMEVDLHGLAIGALEPPQQEKPQPDPVAEAKATAEQQKIALKAAGQQQDMQLQAARAQQEMEMQAAQAQQDMVLQQAEHQQKAQHENENHTTDMLMKMAKERLARISAAKQSTQGE